MILAGSGLRGILDWKQLATLLTSGAYLKAAVGFLLGVPLFAIGSFALLKHSMVLGILVPPFVFFYVTLVAARWFGTVYRQSGFSIAPRVDDQTYRFGVLNRY
jgi:hypothetical protein